MPKKTTTLTIVFLSIILLFLLFVVIFIEKPPNNKQVSLKNLFTKQTLEKIIKLLPSSDNEGSDPNNNSSLPTPENNNQNQSTNVNSNQTPSPPIQNPNLTIENQISYYQLRFVLSTTGRGSRITFDNDQKIFTGKINSSTGNPYKKQITIDSFWVAQLTAGSEISIEADYAVMPTASQGLTIKYEKEANYPSNLKVYYLTDSDQYLLTEIDRQDNGTKNYNLNLNQLLDYQAIQKTIPQTNTDYSVFAFYYRWYNINSWTEDQTFDDDSPLAPYNSNNVGTFAMHISQAQSAGIDGFVDSYFSDDLYFQSLLDEAQKNDFKIMPMAETVWFDQTTWKATPRPAEGIKQLFAQLLINYSDHPAWQKINGRPVIPIYLSYLTPLEDWQNIFTNLRDQGLDAYFLADYQSLQSINKTLDVFDGIYFYGIPENPQNIEEVNNLEAPLLQQIKKMVYYYPIFFDTPEAKLWVPSVNPGYDDRQIPGRQGAINNTYVDRQNGDHYRASFEAAIGSDPDWIFINTWNEWPEHTYIEPSVNYGATYLDITKEYADNWK